MRLQAIIAILILWPLLLLMKAGDICERKFLAKLTPDERDKYLWRRK